MKRIGSLLIHPAAIVASVAMIFSGTIFAATNDKPKAKAHPRPDQTVRVWTNKDIPNLPPINMVSFSRQESQEPTKAPAAPLALTPATDPAIYADQSSALEQELADATSREEALRNFRATAQGLPTGLNVYAPCEGVGTDNLIAQLDARRQELQQQLDDLNAAANANSVSAASIAEAQAAASGPSRDELVARYESLAAQFDEVKGQINEMNAEAAANHYTIPPPDVANGGNMTSNLLADLQNRASALEDEMSAIEGSLR